MAENVQKWTEQTQNQQLPLKTAQVCMHITVHNCDTQHSTEQFW